MLNPELSRKLLNTVITATAIDINSRCIITTSTIFATKKQAMLPTASATPLIKTVIKASALIQTAEVL